MVSRKEKYNEYLKLKIPIGSLVRVNILDRIDELGVVVDANYGLVRNSWYIVHSLSNGKQYTVYPNEIVWLKSERKGDE